MYVTQMYCITQRYSEYGHHTLLLDSSQMNNIVYLHLGLMYLLLYVNFGSSYFLLSF